IRSRASPTAHASRDRQATPLPEPQPHHPPPRHDPRATPADRRLAPGAHHAPRVHLPRALGAGHAHRLGQPLHGAQRGERLPWPAPPHATPDRRGADAALKGERVKCCRFIARALACALLFLPLAAEAAFMLTGEGRISIPRKEISYRPDTGADFEEIARQKTGWISQGDKPFLAPKGPVRIWAKFDLPAS